MSDHLADATAQPQPIIANKPIVTPILRDNYFAIIKNSAGSHLFREWYCAVDGERKEVMHGGNFSCAFYVTSIMKLLDLASEIQITVHRAMAEMERSGWTRIDSPKPGAVVVWDAIPAEDTTWGTKAKHIGFCLDDGMAMSNDSKAGGPAVHPLDDRPVLAYYWHPKLEE